MQEQDCQNDVIKRPWKICCRHRDDFRGHGTRMRRVQMPVMHAKPGRSLDLQRPTSGGQMPRQRLRFELAISIGFSGGGHGSHHGMHEGRGCVLREGSVPDH